MTSDLVRSFRPLAAGTAALLALGLLQVAPAVADEPDAKFELSVSAVYPYDQEPGLTGTGPAAAANAGTAPGSVLFSVQLGNIGDEALRGITVSTRAVTNGQVGATRCSTTPIDVGDGGPTARTAAAQRAGTSWTDPDLVLPPVETLYCTVEISGITGAALNEDVVTATAVGVSTGSSVTHDRHVWAAAGDLRPPLPPAVSITGTSWFDRNDNHAIDGYPDEPGKDEPLLAGLRLRVTGPDGKPVPDYETGSGVVAPVTTDADGSFTLTHLRPATRYYTVSLDLRNPVLAGMAKAPDADGSVSADGSTWSQQVFTLGGHGFSSWRFVPEHLLHLTIDAPSSVIAGRSVTITGRADRADIGAWQGPVVLERSPSGGGWDDWVKVTDVANRAGVLSVTVTPTRSTSYRFRHVADADASAATSAVDRVSVFTAPVLLTATAPTTAQEGRPLTVSGTIKRSGKPFQTGRIELEHTLDNKSWTRVAEVRSTAGVMTATVPATRTGSYRWHYLGDSVTSPGTSSNRHVVVSPASSAR